MRRVCSVALLARPAGPRSAVAAGTLLATLFLATLFLATLFAAAVPDGKRWWSYVEALANDEMRGRDTGSVEHLKAARYVAGEFARFGLNPAGVPDKGAESYIQPVKFKARKLVESACGLELIRG